MFFPFVWTMYISLIRKLALHITLMSQLWYLAKQSLFTDSNFFFSFIHTTIYSFEANSNLKPESGEDHSHLVKRDGNTGFKVRGYLAHFIKFEPNVLLRKWLLKLVKESWTSSSHHIVACSCNVMKFDELLHFGMKYKVMKFFKLYATKN